MTRTPASRVELHGSVPRSENAGIRPDVPGGRVRRVPRHISRTVHVKGGIQMAKKAKGAKKKAAKKR